MGIRFGYRAVEEKYQPSKLLDFAILAERQGFEFICISDHFHPWFHKGGYAGHAWIWMAAAGAKTSIVRLGTGVTTCIYRYHPAIVAQAFASLDEMFPGRIYIGIGTGEAMNEMPIGLRWPPYGERLQRTIEAVQIMKLLWEKDFVDFDGKYFSVMKANLYTKPRSSIPIYFAASGPKAAKASGMFGDALMMGHVGHAHARRILTVYDEGVKDSGRKPEDMPRMVELKISYDEDFEKALDSMALWRPPKVSDFINQPIADPREIDRLRERVDPKVLAERVYTDMDSLIREIEGYIKVGFNEVQVGSSSPDEEKFILRFGKEALPYLKEQYSPNNTH